MKDKGFVWERPLRRADLEALGDSAPDGPILGARVEHLVAKEALLADDPDVFFTTPHFDGYPAVLVAWSGSRSTELEELIVEAWLAPRAEAAGQGVPRCDELTTARVTAGSRTRSPAGRRPR